jgi:hypothetical protein
MSPSAVAREIANTFVMKHRATFGEVDENEINAAVAKVARAIKGLQVAERRAQKVSESNRNNGHRNPTE